MLFESGTLTFGSHVMASGDEVFVRVSRELPATSRKGGTDDRRTVRDRLTSVRRSVTLKAGHLLHDVKVHKLAEQWELVRAFFRIPCYIPNALCERFESCRYCPRCILRIDSNESPKTVIQ